MDVMKTGITPARSVDASMRDEVVFIRRFLPASQLAP
jgi:hypothetical protein